MKRTLSIITLAAVGVVGLSLPGFTNNGGAPTGRSGSPGSNNNTCATGGCHGGGPSISAQTIDITSNIPATGFVENTDYTITITANANGSVGTKIGFEASVENASGSHQGTITATDILTQKTGANFITHRASGTTPTAGSSSWSFNWNSGTAEDQSAVYVAVNFANGNGTTSGDAIGTAMLTLDKASGIGMEENAIADVSVYPNPTADYLNISMETSSSVDYTILDLNGRVLENGTSESSEFRIGVNRLSKGNYILHLVSGSMATTERFTVK
ncbi:T9SS type A sorting domain-containing protein [Phaeocystidibacter marisrubri]|uniref:T9SS type A sorting domain-containing protein n=1 Tax=Phaeocystidibacter marisrubri TaxID=1577780 RepID=A0A6L3ZE69_9FLAO|nr:T9SS type A sorting domain-containing protein [Phaeocystidibacter marisrubri]KAB2816125.1 T9SS type A sorting domain-containing protein [Phaeocystidibacter marisrubri]GGH67452.1 hypothetical protein GCM10011318_06440 [Phaeocystidibacter marisrubri]